MKQKVITKNNIRHDQRAFTLVEVMLYLAITGLVVMIGLNALGGQTGRVRYTDSMRSLQSFINSQYSEFESGVKPTNQGCSYDPSPSDRVPDITNNPSDSDGSCILLGKVILFQTEAEAGAGSETARVYNLVGRNVPTFGDDPDTCNLEDFRCLDPYVINYSSPATYQMLWGTRFTRGVESRYFLFGNDENPLNFGMNVANDNVRGFGWLKSPSTNDPVIIVFGNDPAAGSIFTANDLRTQSIYLSHEKALEVVGTPPRVALGEEVGSGFCFRSPNGQRAVITVGLKESQGAVGLVMSDRTEFHVCT